MTTPPTWRALVARARKHGMFLDRGARIVSLDRHMANGGTEEMFRVSSFHERHDLILRSSIAAALEQLEARR